MIYRKNIKDVYDVDIKGGTMHTIFRRIDSTQFVQSFSMDNPKYDICSKCGENLTNGDNHDKCVCEVVDELYVAQEIANMLEDDEENVIRINNGREDCIYISLSQ